MKHRIFLVHPTAATVEPLRDAIRREWPGAPVFNLLDDSLYGAMDAEGTITTEIRDKVRQLFDYCEASGADAILFTGSTFGPAVDEARAGRRIPVLKPDEAMADAAVALDRPIFVLCTAKRAISVVIAGLEDAAKAAGKGIKVEGCWVQDAQAALAAGRADEHERLIAEAASAVDPAATLVLGQISMAPCLPAVEMVFGGAILSSPSAAIDRLKKILIEKEERSA